MGGREGGREKAFRVPLRNGGLSEEERECVCVVETGLGFKGIRLGSIHRAMEGFNNNQNNTTVALMEQADDATEAGTTSWMDSSSPARSAKQIHVSIRARA